MIIPILIYQNLYKILGKSIMAMAACVFSKDRIQYPIFEKSKRYTLDQFWIRVFEECSRGNFPHGMSFDQLPQFYLFTFLHTAYGKKYKIDRQCKKDPLSVYKTVKNGLQKKGVHSPKEVPKDYGPILRFEKWSQIRSKSLKEELIGDYIAASFPRHESRAKFHEIMSKLQTKEIGAEDVMLEAGKVKSIYIKSSGEKRSVRASVRTNIKMPYEQRKKKKTQPLTNAILNFTKERLARLDAK